MNNFYSSSEYFYPRWITPLLQTAVDHHPAVVLTGARQVGKSTLLRRAEPFRSWRFHTLDDFDVQEQVQQNPSALWAGADNVVIDEVQKAPSLLPAIKQAIDSQPGRYRFILSGSANLLLMQQVSESLAGRAVYFVLHPLTLGEQGEQPPPNFLQWALTGNWPDETTQPVPPDVLPWLLKGLMPALLPFSEPDTWVRWWDGYVRTYLERDLRQISQVDALIDFRRVMELLALRTAQLLNQSEIARDAGLSQPTVHRYLNLLETTHLFERLPPYLRNRTSRLLKSPKVMWADPGLAVFLAGYYTQDDLQRARERGNFFETFIYHHLRVLCGLLTPAARLYFWRTQRGDEVDFVVEHGRRVLAVEIKQTIQPRYGDANGLRAFLQAHPDAVGGVLIHSGTAVRRLDDQIIAIPWPMLTGSPENTPLGGSQ